MSIHLTNTWYCSVCDFHVFNTKSQCNKCLTQKPKPKPILQTNKNSSYDPEFDKEICQYFNSRYLESRTTCTVCKKEGRVFNKDHILSNHNCWKYS